MYNIECGMKLRIHFQTSTVQPLKFWQWIGNLIPHIIMGIVSHVVFVLANDGVDGYWRCCQAHGIKIIKLSRKYKWLAIVQGSVMKAV